MVRRSSKNNYDCCKSGTVCRSSLVFCDVQAVNRSRHVLFGIAKRITLVSLRLALNLLLHSPESTVAIPQNPACEVDFHTQSVNYAQHDGCWWGNKADNGGDLQMQHPDHSAQVTQHSASR